MKSILKKTILINTGLILVFAVLYHFSLVFLDRSTMIWEEYITKMYNAILRLGLSVTIFSSLALISAGVVLFVIHKFKRNVDTRGLSCVSAGLVILLALIVFIASIIFLEQIVFKGSVCFGISCPIALSRVGPIID